jgi:nitroimidazol reductase NimA-like FMN-containing flavoprotein (pyridoxamine 5'-phosphate oxidase superfamily)
MIMTLDRQQAHDVFESARVARLGCIVDGQPYIVPINYNFEGDCIYSHSLPGLKITGLRENPRACIQVDHIESDFRWRSAIAFGTFEEITKPEERADTLNKLLVRFPMLTPVEDAIAVDGYSPEVVVFRIKIDRVTGVSEG